MSNSHRVIAPQVQMVASPAGTENRLRFWETDECLKCPVVGVCLTLAEQKRLLKKIGLATRKRSSFEVHELLVASGENENRLSRRVDRALERKYGRADGCWCVAERDTFLAHFHQAFASGDYNGAVWAAAVNPKLPIEAKREIFGTIHMTMHQNGCRYQQVKQKQVRQQKEIGKLRQHLKETIRDRRELRKECDDFRRRQAGADTALAMAENEKQQLARKLADLDQSGQVAGLEQENAQLKAEVETLRHLLKDKQCLAIALKEKQRQLIAERDHQREMNVLFRKEIQTMMSGVRACRSCGDQCPGFDLCQRRVLIVGGLTRMETLYRELIEGSGGIFDYHDGYMHKGARHLESRLQRADVVLCPVNCNSHNACSVVKTLAKKHNKTVHMLSNSSLNAVSRAIWGTGAEQGTLN